MSVASPRNVSQTPQALELQASQHHDARLSAWHPLEGPDMSVSSPITSGDCARLRGRESHQCQPTLGSVQAEPVFRGQAAYTEEFDGWADVDEGGGLSERAE
jgi:hypothetical protein